MLRNIVRIDEEKCNGCGECVPSCEEGAIQVIDGKARLVSEIYCDGLGNCLGTCPQDAITIEEREADAFDEEAVEEHLAKTQPKAEPEPCACPGSRMRQIEREPAPPPAAANGPVRSELTQWPVQLALVPPGAPYFKEADLLLVADCVPFAYGDFHGKFLRGRPIAVGCPKLDDNDFYVDKLAAILTQSDVKSVTVARMEVPCCGGLVWIAEQAVAKTGRDIPLKSVTIGIGGELIDEQ